METLISLVRTLLENNVTAQAQAVAAAQQAAPQPPQVDPQIEMIRTVAAIIKAQNEAATADEAELEFHEPEEDDDGEEETGPSGNELGQIAELIAALKAARSAPAAPPPAPAPAPEPPVPVFPERLATPFALMALGIADGFAAWTSFGSGVALLSGYWEKPPAEKCLFFEFANHMVRVPQGIGIAMELLFDADLREAANAMMFQWNALTRGQIVLERLREMWARDPAMIDASRLVRQRMCAAVMRYLKAEPKKAEDVTVVQGPVQSAEPAQAIARPEQAAPPPQQMATACTDIPEPSSVAPFASNERIRSPPRTRAPRTSLGMLSTFAARYPYPGGAAQGA